MMKAFRYLILIIFSAMCSAAVADLCDFSPENTLDLADVQFIGEASEDRSGYSVASAGDVDGDGLSDILIGAPNCWNGGMEVGKSYLMLGSTIMATGGKIDLSTADCVFTGENIDNYCGRCVASAGDVDGDGRSDVLIGAWGNDDGGVLAGKTYLVLGSTITGGTFDLANAYCAFIGENDSDFSGYSVSGAGDVDGDGISDILIGAYGNDSYTGKTYLIFGATIMASGGGTIDLSTADCVFIGENASDRSGWSVSGAGDVNGDGYDDILIGAYGNDDVNWSAGKTYLVFGDANLGGTVYLSNADGAFTGADIYDCSGCSVSGAGDVNGDGLSDILIGAHSFSPILALQDLGKAYLIFGDANLGGTTSLSNADCILTGENNGDLCGFSVSGAGDVDGDGFSDILIGAYGYRDGADIPGKAYLVLGNNNLGGTIDLSSADYAFTGEKHADYCGYSVASAGDVDGDGLSDILIGANGNDEGGTDAGKTYLVFAFDTTIPHDAIYVDCGQGNPNGPGGPAAPFDTINGGISAAQGAGITRVIVRGGFYYEVVELRPYIEVTGELRWGFLPPFICGDGSSAYIVEATSCNWAGLKYFVVFNGGIRLDFANGTVIEENIIFKGSNISGSPLYLCNWSCINKIRNNIIYHDVYDSQTAVEFGANCNYNEFINNTVHVRDYSSIQPNDIIGIYLEDDTYNNDFRNNIIQCNTNANWGGIGYGFYANGANFSAAIQYNLTPANNFGMTLDATNITAGYADFVSFMPWGFDYHLNPGSPCIDAGDPAPDYYDPDGTLNDMGAYGGPGYLDFKE